MKKKEKRELTSREKYRRKKDIIMIIRIIMTIVGLAGFIGIFVITPAIASGIENEIALSFIYAVISILVSAALLKSYEYVSNILDRVERRIIEERRIERQREINAMIKKRQTEEMFEMLKAI